MADETRDLIKSHAGLFVAAISSLAVIFRVLAIADYQPWTALAVLTSTGAPGVVLGTVVVTIPYVTPLIALTAWWGILDGGLSPAAASAWGILAITAVAVSLLATPAVVLLVILVLGGLDLVLRRKTRSSIRPARPAADRFLPILLGTLPLIWGASTPWIAQEKLVSVTEGVMTGYVLSTDSRWTHVLLTDTRTVSILETVDITGRTYCQDPIGLWSATLLRLQYLDRLPPGMPPC